MTSIALKGTQPLAACLLSLFLFPLAAAAQDSPAAAALSAQPTQGPMTIERVKSGFVAAPDFKVTRFDGETSELLGGYGGYLVDQTFFVGGGAYWLVNGPSQRSLAYGGLVLGVQVHADRRVGFAVKGLIGGGEATLLGTYTPLPPRPRPRGASSAVIVVPTTFRFDQGFFVAEPEAHVLFRLTNQMRLTAGVGYRLIGDAWGADDQIRGATGSVALQIGGGS